MIAEGDARRRAQCVDSAQHCEGFGTAIDQVADEPQSIPIRREAQLGEQGAQFVVASLHVTDRVQRHQPAT